ncbi:MAG: hypothetical protein Q8Q32_03555, partial [bacterium]|nr:hypothetical protein [bacterium]
DRYHNIYQRYAKAAHWAVEKVQESFEEVCRGDFGLLKAIIKECYVKWKDETSARKAPRQPSGRSRILLSNV